MTRVIQTTLDLGDLGEVDAEIEFDWHPGQKLRVSANPERDQEGIEPHCEGISKVFILGFPSAGSDDLDVTARVMERADVYDRIVEVIEDFMAYAEDFDGPS